MSNLETTNKVYKSKKSELDTAIFSWIKKSHQTDEKQFKWKISSGTLLD